jgi:hypothetical protein
MVQAQVLVPEVMEETIQELEKFFKNRNVKFTVTKPETDEEGTVWVYFEFKEPVKLSESQFEELTKLLKDLDYYWANGAENQIANYIGYQEWLESREYRNLYEDVVVYMKYIKTVGNNTTYYLKGLSVATNTTQ